MEELNLQVTDTSKLESYCEDYVVLCLTLPMSSEQLAERLKKLDARKTTILSYSFEGLLSSVEIRPTTSITGLNQLMQYVENLDENCRDEFLACMEYWDGMSFNNIIQKFRSVQHNFFAGIEDDEELALYITGEFTAYEVSDYVKDYVNFEELGRDYRISHNGKFVSTGYIEET